MLGLLLFSVSSVEDATLVGNRNTISESDSINALGSDMSSHGSDHSTVVAHQARMLSSDETSILGSEINVTNSDSAVAVGHNLNLSDSDHAVAIGSHLQVDTPTQVMLGQYNAPSTAKFVLASGSENAPLNLLEINADGSIVNSYIDALAARVTALELQLSLALSACSDPACEDIQVAFHALGCCPAE